MILGTATQDKKYITLLKVYDHPRQKRYKNTVSYFICLSLSRDMLCLEIKDSNDSL